MTAAEKLFKDNSVTDNMTSRHWEPPDLSRNRACDMGNAHTSIQRMCTTHRGKSSYPARRLYCAVCAVGWGIDPIQEPIGTETGRLHESRHRAQQLTHIQKKSPLELEGQQAGDIWRCTATLCHERQIADNHLMLYLQESFHSRLVHSEWRPSGRVRCRVSQQVRETARETS